jgi:hypothetical protein
MELRPDQESAISTSLKARKQDTKIPFLININDGRLMPNVPNIASHQDYRPYRGDPYAKLPERMAYVASIAATRRVIDSSASDVEREPVDIGKMEKTELIAFAYDEYGLILQPDSKIGDMRKLVMATISEGASKPVDMSE